MLRLNPLCFRQIKSNPIGRTVFLERRRISLMGPSDDVAAAEPTDEAAAVAACLRARCSCFWMFFSSFYFGDSS